MNRRGFFGRLFGVALAAIGLGKPDEAKLSGLNPQAKTLGQDKLPMFAHMTGNLDAMGEFPSIVCLWRGKVVTMNGKPFFWTAPEKWTCSS